MNKLHDNVNSNKKLVKQLFGGHFSGGTIFLGSFSWERAYLREVIFRGEILWEVAFFQAAFLRTLFLKTLNKNAPVKKKYIRANQSSFMILDLRKAIMIRLKLRNEFLKEKK